jgi:glutaconate CoA-transferase subunit B
MVGANMPMARAAAVMANLTTHPDARILIGLGVQALGSGGAPPAVHPFLFDPRTLAAEALMYQAAVFDDVRSPDVFFLSGLQLDRRGNLNLFGIPDGSGGWKVRGPGSVALASMSTNCRGYYIVMPRHDPRTFVERVPLISALGDAGERARLGFPGGGPRLVLSPLGVFDFDEDGDLRVRSLHASVSRERLREATGFDLEGPSGTPETPAPTAAELELLRTRVDPHGTLAG